VADTTTSMTREQRAVAEFSDAMSQLRSRIELPGGRLAVDALTEAAVRFGTCELRMRRSERLQALGPHGAEAKALAESALSNNERGLEALPGARPLVDQLSKREADSEALSLWRESSPRLRADWREQVAELDMGPDEARHLIRIADECCDAVDAEGLGGLGRHLSHTLETLDEVRRSEDRGTHTASYFPWWKIVMAALLWGIGVGVAYDMITNGAPWWQPWLVWVVIGLLTLVVALGC
jgi:hypothetical protein